MIMRDLWTSELVQLNSQQDHSDSTFTAITIITIIIPNRKR